MEQPTPPERKGRKGRWVTFTIIGLALIGTGMVLSILWGSEAPF